MGIEVKEALTLRFRANVQLGMRVHGLDREKVLAAIQAVNLPLERFRRSSREEIVLAFKRKLARKVARAVGSDRYEQIIDNLKL